MAHQQKNTNIYNIKIADLSCDSKLILSDSDEKKVQRFFKDTQFYYPYQLYISIDMNIADVLTKKFKNLIELRAAFKTNEDCKRFLEEVIWEGEPVHPEHPESKVYKCRDGWYKCKDNGKEFNILTKTFLQNTKKPLPIWFELIFRLCSDRSGLAATTVAREYGITELTAENMLHKIRNAMGFENHQQLKGKVEADEYYFGGLHKNMHGNKRWEAKQKTNQGKKLLQGFVERGGNAVINVIPDRTESTVNAGVLRYVEPGAAVYTDDYQGYNKLPPIYKRGVVVHSDKIYVNKDNNDIHTNGIESLWANFHRMEEKHIHISEKHLQNYANEVVFRYNTRKMPTQNACVWLLQNMQGTNITWEEIRNAKYKQYNRNQTRAA